MLIKIEDVAADGLGKAEWGYYATTSFGTSSNLVVVLDSYRTYTRPTKRHGWRPTGAQHLRTGRKYESNISAADVPEPPNGLDGVRMEAALRIVVLPHGSDPR